MRGADSPVLLRVDKSADDYLIVTIPKHAVSSINMTPDASNLYPDSIYFANMPHARVWCKIIEITGGAYKVELPADAIESVRIDRKRDSDKDDPLGMELLEDMDLHEPKTNNRQVTGGRPARNVRPDSLDREALKEQIKEELMESLYKAKEIEEEKILADNTGKVTGKIMRFGKPYPNCKVRIVALTKERVLFAKVIKRGENMETVTDENGMYYFKNVSPGNYKLFWRPHYETSWIRRLDMKPDVFVTAGKTTFQKTLEIGKRVLN